MGKRQNDRSASVLSLFSPIVFNPTSFSVADLSVNTQGVLGGLDGAYFHTPRTNLSMPFPLQQGEQGVIIEFSIQAEIITENPFGFESEPLQ